MIEGKKVKLTAIDEGDLEQLCCWRNNIEFRKYFREFREISKYSQKKWFETKVNNDLNTFMFSIKDVKTNELLGCCGLCYVHWVNRTADLSLYIGHDLSYIDDKGLAEESCKLLLSYGFNELNLNRIWTEIYQFDEKKFKLFKNIGLTVEGELRQSYYFRNKYYNSIILSILKEEFVH